MLEISEVKELITNSPDDFLVISGDDDSAYQSVLMGGDGVISVVAGCIPKEFSQIISMSVFSYTLDEIFLHIYVCDSTILYHDYTTLYSTN